MSGDEYLSEEELTEDEEEEEVEVQRAPSKQRKPSGGGKRGRKQAEYQEDDDEEEADDDRKRARIFFDEQADVDDDEEDDLEGEEHDDLIDDDLDEVHEDAGTRQELHASIRKHREEEHEQTAEELERYVQERYYQGRQDRDMDDGDTTAIGQQSLLPTIRDTKMWMMRCRPGMEREICICAMQKAYNMADRGKPLQVKSVFFQDHLKGYIYIEADKESHVKDNMSGLQGLMWSKGVKLVPIQEMVDAVTVNTKAKQKVERDAWVRVRSGVYAGDLARVIDIDNGAGRATIKIVPRLDYNALANKERVPFGKQPKIKPAQRAFSYQEAKEYGLVVERRRDPMGDGYIYVMGTQRFVDGYALRVVSLKGLVPLEDVMPPVDELQRFNQAKQSAQDDDGTIDAQFGALMQGVDDKGDSGPTVVFERGDKVEVVEGDLKELTGRVTGRTEEGKVIVMPDMQDLDEALTFDPSQLTKFFNPGDHVKCTNGKHIGNTGMVVKAESGVCVVFSDMTQKEFRAFARDLAESAEVATGADKIGDYDLHDLVVLDHQTVGVIVHVEKDSCRVLTNQGLPDKPDIRVCRLPDIKRSIPQRLMRPTSDMNSSQVAVNDQVTIADGAFKGRAGTVKYIHRGMLFIQSRESNDHGGFTAIRSRNVRAKTGGGASRGGGGGGFGTPGSAMTPTRPGVTPQSPAAFGMRQSPQSPAPGRPGAAGAMGARGAPTAGMYSGGRANQARRDSALIGQTIKITKGQWRGYCGRVRDATDTVVRLELEAQNRVVTVARGSLKFEEVAGRGGPPSGGRGFGGRGGGSFGGRGMGGQGRGGSGGMSYPETTPFHGGATPARGSATPAHPGWGGATPSHPGLGGATPRRGGQTPMRDSAWNPLAAATPAHPGVAHTPADDPYAAHDAASTPMTPFDKQAPPGTPAAYTPYEAATPGDGHAYAPAMTPAGGGVAATPGTPGGGYGSARTPYEAAHTPGGALGAPTPGADTAGTPFTPGAVGTPGMVATPGASHTPFTPGGMAGTPGTPGLGEPMSPGPGGGGGDGGMDLSLLTGLLVSVPASAEGVDGGDDRVGVVTGVDLEGGVATVLCGSLGDDGGFASDGAEIRVSASEVSLVAPQKKNAVKIVRGEHRGQTGSLIGVDVADGIVKLDLNTDIKILELSSLGRLVQI